MSDYIKAAVGMYLPNPVETEELEGQGMVEYGLILALVAVVAAAVLVTIGDEIVNTFNDVVGQLQGAGN